MLRRFGCTLVLLGRTDPDAVPAELLALDDDAFEANESAFYSQELGKGTGARLPGLKQRYDGYRSAREVNDNLRMLCVPGKVVYLRADVTDEPAVDAALARVAAEYGRLDMVLHGGDSDLEGAGPQEAGRVPRHPHDQAGRTRQPTAGRRRHFPAGRIHFHPITSSFSQIGNAGQQDYGAANLAMDRVAQHISATSDSWEASSLGWLGWFRVGMTRGSEYATLAVMRRLRPIPRAEGAALFETFLSGRPVTPTLHLMSAQEAQAFGFDITAESSRSQMTWSGPPNAPLPERSPAQRRADHAGGLRGGPGRCGR